MNFLLFNCSRLQLQSLCARNSFQNRLYFLAGMSYTYNMDRYLNKKWSFVSRYENGVLKESKSVRPEEVESYLATGWRLGRRKTEKRLKSPRKYVWLGKGEQFIQVYPPEQEFLSYKGWKRKVPDIGSNLQHENPSLLTP